MPLRPSNKTVILDAAVAVIEADGITAVTFDSVAAAADLTRGGIIYHYRSREELIRALHQHLADVWEQQLIEACGKTVDEATPLERLVAYVRVAAQSASRAELQMMIDSRNTENEQPWAEVLDRWTPPYPDAGPDLDDDAAWTALLAADGLWVNDVINQRELSASRRAHLVEQIVAQLQAAHP